MKIEMKTLNWGGIHASIWLL